jgi:uncharacterized repeat protein (TIGR01451 family)
VIPERSDARRGGQRSAAVRAEGRAPAVDNGSPGIVDPLDTLHYTITIYNTGAVPATGVVLTDACPRTPPTSPTPRR